MVGDRASETQLERKAPAQTVARRPAVAPSLNSAAGVLALQQSAGNRAVARAIKSSGPTLARCGGGKCGCGSCADEELAFDNH